MRWLLTLLLGLAAQWPGHAWAEVVRTLHLESTPSGAQVFLLTGGERKPIGTTPTSYEAEFHSEVSVLRFAFVRAGSAEMTLEVGADRDRVVATLKAASVVADAEKQPDPALRRQQEQITPAVTAVLRDGVVRRGGVEAALEGMASLQRIGTAVYLVVPVSLQMKAVNGADADKGALAQQVWRDLASDLSSRLRSALPSAAGVNGIIVNTAIPSTGSSFAVNSRVEAKTELTCIPGTVMVFSSCATMAPVYETSCYNGNCSTRQSGTRCAPGNTPQYSPCATKGPITKFAMKNDPQIGFQQMQVRVLSIVSLPAKGTASPTGLLHVDANGKMLFEQGDIPAAIKAELARKAE
ncbi:hypothetical protein BH09PSE6_BH09PSE6_12570 [soil metagenome]